MVGYAYTESDKNLKVGESGKAGDGTDEWGGQQSRDVDWADWDGMELRCQKWGLKMVVQGSWMGERSWRGQQRDNYTPRALGGVVQIPAYRQMIGRRKVSVDMRGWSSLTGEGTMGA